MNIVLPIPPFPEKIISNINYTPIEEEGQDFLLNYRVRKSIAFCVSKREGIAVAVNSE